MNVHTFFMINRAYWERPGLSVAGASDLSREGENRREEAKIFAIFMQEQVHTVAYVLQVNRFQTTVDLKVNNDSDFLCCSYDFRGMSGVLGSWYRLQYPIGGGQGPTQPHIFQIWYPQCVCPKVGLLVVSSPPSVDGSGTGDCWSGRTEWV